MIKSCLDCGAKFVTYPSKVRLGKGKYCSKQCSDKHTLIKKGQRLSPETEIKKGDKPWNSTGWRYTQARKNGKKYILIHMPHHPFASKAGYVRKHRLVMEQQLGRYLRPEEVVDHINGDTLNNNPSNLRVMSKVEHDRMNTPLNIHRRWQNKKGGLPYHGVSNAAA